MRKVIDAAHMFFSGRESSAYSRQTRWDLFDTAGSYLGAFPMPENFNPMVVRGREVFGVQTTELGIEDVVGFRAVH